MEVNVLQVRFEGLLGRVSVFLCSQLAAGERSLVRRMRAQVEEMMNRYPEGCTEKRPWPPYQGTKGNMNKKSRRKREVKRKARKI